MKSSTLRIALATLAGVLVLQGAALAASVTPAAAPAAAVPAMQVASAPGTPQHNKMKACNADAKQKNLHGAERRAFMKQCLSKGPTPS